MEIDFKERIQPGILFLSTLGYKLLLPKIINKWETIDILNVKNEKIGNAYFGKNYIEMMGEDSNLKFTSKYNLKKYQNEDKIIANIIHLYYNTTYRMQVNLIIKSSLVGKNAINVKMQVYSDNHQEFSLIISDYNHSLILDSFDTIRGKEHIEISHDEKQFTIVYQKENKDTKTETMAFYPNAEKVYTISKVTYENGEDVRKRYYPLIPNENLIYTLSYYLNEIDPAFKISFWELNSISNGLFLNLLPLSFPEFKEEDIYNLFGLSKKDIKVKGLVRNLEK